MERSHALAGSTFWLRPSGSSARKRARITFCASATALITALTGCAGGGGETNAVSTTIALAASSDPSSFNPALAQGNQTFNVDRLLYDTVLRRDKDSTIVGGLATEWDAKSASEYTFKIRDDATCADGTPISASVVADSLNYFASPKAGSAWKALVFGTGIPTITADNAASTVAISLSTPFAPLLEGLTVAQSGIICPAGLADLEGLRAGTVNGAFSGPYTLNAATAGQSYQYKLREDYDAWPQLAAPLGGAPAKAIDIRITKDQSTVSNQLMSGDLNFAELSDAGSIARFANNNDFNQFAVQSFSTYIIFNERPGRVFADKPELRKAVAQAISRDGFNTVYSGGKAELLTSIAPSSYACVNKDESLLEPYDAGSAAAGLKGITGIKMPATTFSKQFTDAADYVYKSLTDAGAVMALNKVDNATFQSTIATEGADWDMALVGLTNPIGALSASLDRVIGTPLEDGGRNYIAGSNPKGEAALTAALATVDKDNRCAAYQDAQESILERDDVVPLASDTIIFIGTSDVTIRVFGDSIDFATLRLNE